MKRGVGVAVGFALLALALVVGLERRARPPSAPAAPAFRAPARSSARVPSLPPVRLSEASASAEAAAPAGELEGRVISTASGRPVARSALTFAHGGAAFSVSADERGEFRLVASEPGAYELTAIAAAGFLAYATELGRAPITFVARAGVRVRGVTLYLVPAADYLGVVTDPKGRPVAGAEVRRGEPLDGEPDAFTTDARGEFHFHAPDGAELEARHAGFAPGRARLTLAAQVSKRLTIELGPPGADDARGEIAGIVVDAQGAPVEAAALEAEPVEPERAARDHSPGSARDELAGGARGVSGADGRFVLRGLATGEYEVTAKAGGQAPAIAPRVAAGTRDLRLVVRAGGAVRGVVRDRSGAAMAAFTVLVRERRGPLESGEPRAESFLDGEGRYEVRGLAPGSYAVSAVAYGRARSAEQLVDVAAAPAEPVRADFQLGRGGQVSGVVVDARSGAPIAGARVSTEGAAADSPVPLFSSTTTDGAGRFTLGGLEPGPRTILAAAEGHHTRYLSGLRVESDGELGPLTVELTPTEPGEEPRIELAGINAVLKAEGDALVLTAILPGGGAAQAGLGPGDRVLRVDGAAVTDLGFGGAVERLRGPEGTTVVLSVAHEAGGAAADVTVTRRRVIAPPSK